MKKTCGLDVHKDTVFCAVFDGKKHGEVKQYSTVTPSLYSMGENLQLEGVRKIAIESTGSYWIPVWNILEEMGFELILVNPYLIKQMPGRKSDVKDAQWIATLLYKGMLRSSLVPDKTIRELRVYSRQYVKLQQKRTSILQSIERNLEMCGIRITSYVSNISGKSVLRIVEQIIEGVTDPEELIVSIHGRIVNKHKADVIKESLTGFVTSHHRFILKLHYEEYKLIETQSEMYLQQMKKLTNEHYSKQMTLLKTIPGVSEISAMIIIAETGADMKAFENSGKFAGWTGLRPRNDETAGKYKSTATTKGNKFLRAILVQVAWAASRTKGSYFKEKFNQLAIRKPRKKALIAIARKMTVIIWNMLNFETEFTIDKLQIYNPLRVQMKVKYHQKEVDRLKLLINR